ncbi:MAG: alpha/beta-type small acid-soluble spore protein [Bacillota bacterium]|nr:alpha/beta-type small acid-soluble spore protein [Bacillota bacterium]
MALGQSGSGRTQLVPDAHPMLDDMKYEIAEELNLGVHKGSEDYWGKVTSRDCGRVGGTMVKKLISMAEDDLTKGRRA